MSKCSLITNPISSQQHRHLTKSQLCILFNLVLYDLYLCLLVITLHGGSTASYLTLITSLPLETWRSYSFRRIKHSFLCSCYIPGILSKVHIIILIRAAPSERSSSVQTGAVWQSSLCPVKKTWSANESERVSEPVSKRLFFSFVSSCGFRDFFHPPTSLMCISAVYVEVIWH